MSEEQPSTTKTLKSNGLGTAALVLGIICLVFAFIPFVDYASGVIGFVGLILGIVGLAGKGKKKNIALVGTIISAVALIMSIVMAVVWTAAFATAVDQTIKEKNTPVKVVYDVTGNSKDATITYSTYTNNTIGTEQATDKSLPFTKIITGTKSFSSFSLTASNGSTGTDITCKITVDGKVVSTQTSSGQFASVSCESTN